MATPYDDEEDDLQLPEADTEDQPIETIDAEPGAGGGGAAGGDMEGEDFGGGGYATPVQPAGPARRPYFQGELQAPDRTLRMAAAKARLGMPTSDRELNRIAERQRLEAGPLPVREGLQAPDLETRRAALKVQMGRAPSQKELARLVERQRLEGEQGNVAADYSINTLLAGTRLDPRGTAREQMMQARQAEIERRRQEAAMAREEKAQAAFEKKAYNAEFLRRADETGVQYRMDPMTGLYREKLNAEGQPTFAASEWRPTLDPETGLPRMERRGRTGETEYKRPPLALPANPEHTHLVADMGDGASQDFITFEEAAASPDNSLAKLGLAGIARRKTAVERREIQPYNDAKYMADLEYDNVRTQVDALENEIAQMSQVMGQQSQIAQQTEGGILGIGAGPTPAAQQAKAQMDAMTQQIATRSQQLEEMKRLVAPGGDLHARRMDANLQAQIKSAEFIRNRRRDQEAERLEILKREGGDPETDPTLRAIRQGMDDSQRSLDTITTQRNNWQKALGVQPTPVPPTPTEEPGDFSRGMQVSLGQTVPLLKGLAGLFGETAERAVGKGGIATGLKNWGLRGYQEGMQKLQPLQRENDDVTKAWEKAKQGDIGAFIDWAQYGLGYTVGQIGEAAAMALIGGLAGSAAAPGIGALPGAAAGVAGKSAVRAASFKFIDAVVSKEAAKLVQAAAVKQGVTLTAPQIAAAAAQTAAREAAVKSLARTVGQTAAIGANAFTQELGSIYPKAVAQAQKEGRSELSGTDLARVWATGLAAGGLESLSDKLGLDVALGRVRIPGVGGRAGRAIAGAAGGALVEGGTEVAQTGLERIGAGQSLVDDQALNDYINSGALGAMGGAGVGGGAGFFRAPAKTAPGATPPAPGAAPAAGPTPAAGPSAGPALGTPGVTPSNTGGNPMGAPAKAASPGTEAADADALETIRAALLGKPPAPAAAPTAVPTAAAAIAPAPAPTAAAAPAPSAAPAAQAATPAAAPITPGSPEITPTEVEGIGETGTPAPAAAQPQAAAETPLTQPTNAIRERGPEEVLQRPPEGTGEGGGGRGGVEQGIQGEVPAGTRQVAQQPEAEAQGTPVVPEGEQARIGGEPVGGVERGETEPTRGAGEQAPAQVVPAVSEAVRPERATTSQKSGEFRLSTELAGAKPKYNYGMKGFDLSFERDLDKAMYIAAQDKPSKRDAEYIKAVSTATGLTEPQIRAAGRKIRAQIKEQAAATPMSGTLVVPASNAEQAFARPPTAEAPIAPAEIGTKKSIADQRRRIANMREIQLRLEQTDPARAVEMADRIAEEQEKLAKLIGTKREGKRLGVGLPANKEPDVLNIIEDEATRIRTVPREGEQKGGEFDDWKETLVGVGRLLNGGTEGTKPDQLPAIIQEKLNLSKPPTIPEIQDMISKAIAQRETTKTSVSREEKAQQVEGAALSETREGRHPRYFPTQNAKIEDIGVGGTFTINGEKFEVLDADEKVSRQTGEAQWVYRVKNGHEFTVPEGTMVYADKDSLKAVGMAKPEDITFGGEEEPPAPAEIEPTPPKPAPAPAPAPKAEAPKTAAPAAPAEKKPVVPPRTKAEIELGNQPVGFGKYSGTLVRDLYTTDKAYAEWIAANASTGRGREVAQYIRNQPEFVAAQQGEADKIKQALSPENVKLLNNVKLGFVPIAGTNFLAIDGSTYAWKDTLRDREIGGRFADGRWTLSPDGALKFLDYLRSVPGLASGQVPTVPANVSNPQFRKLREDSARRPDRSGFTEPLSNFVGDETEKLLRKGESVGMAKFVVDEQIEDVARITRAYRDGKKLFVLASEPGSGKTFVNGGAIRELRRQGAKKFVYVTLRQELISQIQKDLKDYNIGDVQFITYNELIGTQKNPGAAPQASDVLIWDEAHAIKNVSSSDEKGVAQRAAAAADWIKQAKFTLFSSATPFENPVESAYLAPTGIFNEVFGNAENFALAHGGKLIEVRKGGQIVNRYIQWTRTPASDADAKAAREFLRKEGVFTSRKIRLPDGMVDSRLVKMDVDSESSKLYNEFETAAAAHDDELYGISKALIVNLQKRMLEAAKVQRGIEEAKAALKRGRFPILFVETKAERTINIPALIEAEQRYAQAMNQVMPGESTPKRSEFGLPPIPVMEVYRTYYENTGQGVIQIPSAEDVIKQQLGEDKVAVFTGSVTPKKAQANLDDWRSGKKPVLVATMAKGGTGLSLHDKAGDHPTTQININLPWSATQVVQVAQRSARYGLKSKAEMQWIFADNIPFDKQLAARVGGRMATMGALVQGERLAGSQEIENWDFQDLPFTETKDITKSALADIEAAATGKTVEQVQAEVDTWRRANPGAPEITVVNDPNWTENGRGVRGQYVDGKLTINAAYSTDVAGDAQHEWAHHTLSSDRGKVALATFATREIPQADMAELLRKYPKQPGESTADHRLRLVEEWVAKNQEKEPGIFRRIVEAVRRWLAGRGLVNLSNAEAARAMLRAVRQEEAAGGPPAIARSALAEEGPAEPGVSRVPESLRRAGLPAEDIEYEVRNQEERWSQAETTVREKGVDEAKRMVMDRGLPMDDRVALAGVLIRDAKLDGVEMNRMARLLQGNVSTEAGQAVAMHAKIYQKLGPQSMVVEHTKRVQEEQQDKLGDKFPADAAQQVTTGLGQAGTEASEAIKDLAEGRKPGRNAASANRTLESHGGILGLLRQAAAEQGIKWADLFTSLPENQQARKDELFKRVQAHERLKNLNEQQQRMVADKLEAAWSDLRNNIFRAEFNRLVELPTVKQADVEKVKSVIDDLIRYSNLGLLDNVAFLDALADKYGIENMNGAIAQRLRELADKIQRETSPAKKAELSLEMMREYQKAKGVRTVDYFQSLMYANILSGYTTLAGGMAVPNFLNSLWQLSTMAVAKPRQAKTLLKGYASGFSEGINQFRSILATGHGGQDPAAMAAETKGDALEMLAMGDAFPKLQKAFPKTYGAMQYHAKAMRYVGRLVRAIDALAYYPAKEAQTWAATEALLASKLTGAALHSKVQQVLGVRPGDFAKYRAQAVAEGYTGYDLSRRISDLLEEHRAGTKVGQLALERGKRFGLGTTLSGEPEGWAGVVYSHVADMVNKVTPGGVPVLKPFFMFLRVPTNFYNLVMAATPWGAFRAYKGEVVTTKREGGKYATRTMSEDERHQLYMQAAIGTALMGYLAARAMSSKPGDDDDLTATGPRSPQARAQWQANGGIPYSIKIPGTDTRVSYQQWPIAVPLAIAGHVADSLRYDDTPDTTTMKRITDSLIRFPSVIFGAPVLNGLSQLADLTNAYRPSTKKAEMFLKNMGTSTVMPRLLTQIDQTFRDDVVKDNGVVRYDSLGEAVHYTPYGRMISGSNRTPLREWLNRQQIVVPVPQRDIKIEGRPHKLTDAEFSELERLAGTRTRVLLEAQLPFLRTLPRDQAEKRVKAIANEQLESVRSMMKATRQIAPVRMPMPTAAR